MKINLHSCFRRKKKRRAQEHEKKRFKKDPLSSFSIQIISMNFNDQQVETQGGAIGKCTFHCRVMRCERQLSISREASHPQKLFLLAARPYIRALARLLSFLTHVHGFFYFSNACQKKLRDDITKICARQQVPQSVELNNM